MSLVFSDSTSIRDHTVFVFLWLISLLHNVHVSKKGKIFFNSYFFFAFSLFRAAPMAYDSCQARGPIRAEAASLPHSHSNVGSETHLRTTAPGNAWSLTHWPRPGIEPMSSWMPVGFTNRWATTGIPNSYFLNRAGYVCLLTPLLLRVWSENNRKRQWIIWKYFFWLSYVVLIINSRLLRKNEYYGSVKISQM